MNQIEMSQSPSVRKMMRHPEAETRAARLQVIGKDILEHVRNVMVSATLLALGLVARSRSAELLGSPVLEIVIGWGVIIVAVALMALNLWIGVSRLRRWKHWRLWSALMLAVYALIFARVLEVVVLLHLEKNNRPRTTPRACHPFL